MGSNGTGNPIIGILLACVAGSLVLAIIGFALHRRGKLSARGPALAWAILTVLPLFGAGFAMMVTHEVDEATGKTKSGQNAPDVRSAP